MNLSLDKYSHISFDLDGTLVHTVPEYRHRIIPAIVFELGGKINNERSVDKFWFEANRDATIRGEFSLPPEKFWKLFREVDTPEERSRHTHAYADAEKAFYKLKESGKIISIITGAPQWIAQMEIAKLNGAPYDIYLSVGETKFQEKPDSKSFFYVLDKLQVKPEETLYIGNSNEDAQFAKNAGVDFLYLERKEHEFDLKDYSIGTIHSLDELF